MAVTNDQLATHLKALDIQMGSLDQRMSAIERILMNKGTNGKNGYVSPLAILLIKWVVFPLIMIIGGVVGVTNILPFGG